MSKEKSKLIDAQNKASVAIQKTNKMIEQLGEETSELYTALNHMQAAFDLIRHVPNDKHQQLEEIRKVRLNWEKQVEKIESDYKKASGKIKGMGVVGTSAGIAVAALGPSAAMGIATSFGVASTGTAISTLSGAAATNAALAWLGGGVLTTGGGGMAAGNIVLAMAGPVGWAIAGATILGGSALIWKAKSEKERIDNIFTLISKRDVTSYQLAIVELNERFLRIKDETHKLYKAILYTMEFGLDYDQMTEEQQYKLGSYVNLMHSSTQLLVNPILGLQPKYTKEDYDSYMAIKENEIEADEKTNREATVIFLSNLLYKIQLSEKDKKIVWKSIRDNKELLSSMNISKKMFGFSIMNEVLQGLEYIYSL